MLNVKLNVFCKKKIKALTNFDIAFLKKVFNFFFSRKETGTVVYKFKNIYTKKKNVLKTILFLEELYE